MATIYINADTGDDTTGDGTSGNPYETLLKGRDEGSAGDTIFLQNATAFYDVGTGGLTASNRFESGTIIEGESVDGVTLDGTGRTNRWESTTLTIKNMTIANFPDQGENGTLVDSRTMGANDIITFQNIIFDNMQESTIYFSSNLGQLVVNRCTFKNFDYNSTTFNLIQSRNAYYTFRSCTFYFEEDTHAFNFYRSSAGQNPLQFNMTNCIMTNDGSATVTMNSAVAVLDYCCYNNVTINGSATINSTTINTDPLLIDPANGNYGLQPDSPCVQTGTN